MTTKKRGSGFRVLAAFGALAVGLLGFTAPASAAVGPNIDAEEVGTITLHKFEQPSPNGDTADGTVQDTTGLTPIDGVVFQYQLVEGVDLTTNEGWERAAEIAGGSSLVTPEALGTAVQFPATDANGTTSLCGLPLGLYLISEVSHPDDSNIVKKIDPFYVTVPLPTIGETPAGTTTSTSTRRTRSSTCRPSPSTMQPPSRWAMRSTSRSTSRCRPSRASGN